MNRGKDEIADIYPTSLINIDPLDHPNLIPAKLISVSLFG